jgi:uncharacterized protein (TIGR03000 family)
MMTGMANRGMGSHPMMGQGFFGMGQGFFGYSGMQGSMGGGYGGGGSGGGGYGSGGGSGANNSYQPSYAMNQMPAFASDEYAVKTELPHRSGEVRSAPPDAAVIRIDLPEDSGRVWIDGQAVAGAGICRYFVTPYLNKGKEYPYAIKVQWTKNEEQVTVERKITVEAGKISKLNFATTVAAR